MFIYIILAVWIICGVLNYGWTYAFFQKSFPTIADENRSIDRRFSALFAVLGIPGTIVIIFVKGWGYGLMWRNK
jgi:hypothetical protein